MSYLAQNDRTRWHHCRAAPLSLLLVLGCADANPAKPDTLTDAHLADSSITSFNALVRVAPLPESDALSGGETTVFDSTSEAPGAFTTSDVIPTTRPHFRSRIPGTNARVISTALRSSSSDARSHADQS